ncbi:MAG: hypothetical protein FJ121_03440 [Deltaproteobacteria bacterium]|nr:hypothetical protein [Deltaproteobacteria bacterium]
MDKKIIAVAALAFWCLGYLDAHAQGAGDYSRELSPRVATDAPKAVGESDLVFDPLTPDISALPDYRDLPFPKNLQTQGVARRYTGIIKNKTRYEVSVPSENSGAALIIPANSWIEYTIWTRRAAVTAYHDGKPFYCLKLAAHPNEYPFMCSKYDFMAEIVKPEGVVGQYKPMKKRKRVKKQPEC